jgi:hypothetical protein
VFYVIISKELKEPVKKFFTFGSKQTKQSTSGKNCFESNNPQNRWCQKKKLQVLKADTGIAIFAINITEIYIHVL